MPPPVTTAWPLSVPSSAYLYQPEMLGNEIPVLTYTKGLSSLDATSSAFSVELNPESMPLPPSSTSTLTHPAATQSILDPHSKSSSLPNYTTTQQTHPMKASAFDESSSSSVLWAINAVHVHLSGFQVDLRAFSRFLLPPAYQDLRA
ncbi:hypothetical protein BDR03DRAFT_1019918 [Suillus americanus]|nr:hypothetical protein BDR03DRAFT_1019918 [Suillus americanus]